MRAVIIDDVSLARASLRADIEDYCPGIEVVGEAEGVISGMKLIKQIKPDIIFLDIHLTDGEGFDILELLQDIQGDVIFTTASDQHAIQAFQANAVDYLLKPIDTDLLIKAVYKCKKRMNTNAGNTALETDTITLSTQDDLRIAKISDVIRLEADGNYTTVYEKDGTKTMVSRSLKAFENLLREKGFIRTHQSHLVQISAIKSYLKSEGGFLKMSDESEVPVAVRKKSTIVKLLQDKSL